MNTTPPPSFIMRSSFWVRNITPLKWTLLKASKSSSVSWSIGMALPIPALLTRKSMRSAPPNSSLSAALSRSTKPSRLDDLEMSSCSACARTPRLLISATTAAPSSALEL